MNGAATRFDVVKSFNGQVKGIKKNDFSNLEEQYAVDFSFWKQVVIRATDDSNQRY